MKKESKRFLVVAVVILAIVITISQLLFSTVFETYNFPGRIICVGFIWLVTCATHYRLMKTVTDKPKAFSRIFMMQTTAKLLLYMACIMAYVVFCRHYAVPFTVHFLVVYFIFAVFEVVSILKFVKNNSGQTARDTKISN